MYKLEVNKIGVMLLSMMKPIKKQQVCYKQSKSKLGLKKHLVEVPCIGK